jgi:hypothetical protein
MKTLPKNVGGEFLEILFVTIEEIGFNWPV